MAHISRSMARKATKASRQAAKVTKKEPVYESSSEESEETEYLSLKENQANRDDSEEEDEVFNLDGVDDDEDEEEEDDEEVRRSVYKLIVEMMKTFCQLSDIADGIISSLCLIHKKLYLYTLDIKGYDKKYMSILSENIDDQFPHYA